MPGVCKKRAGKPVVESESNACRAVVVNHVLPVERHYSAVLQAIQLSVAQVHVKDIPCLLVKVVQRVVSGSVIVNQSAARAYEIAALLGIPDHSEDNAAGRISAAE